MGRSETGRISDLAGNESITGTDGAGEFAGFFFLVMFVEIVSASVADG